MKCQNNIFFYQQQALGVTVCVLLATVDLVVRSLRDEKVCVEIQEFNNTAHNKNIVFNPFGNI